MINVCSLKIKQYGKAYNNMKLSLLYPQFCSLKVVILTALSISLSISLSNSK